MQRSTFNKMKRSNWPQHWSLTKPHIIPPSTLNWSFVFLLIQICLIQNTLSSRYILVKHDCRVVMEKIKTNWICAASKLIAHSWHCPFMTLPIHDIAHSWHCPFMTLPIHDSLQTFVTGKAFLLQQIRKILLYCIDVNVV